MALAPLRNHACMTPTTRGRMCYASVGELDTLVNDDRGVRAHADHSQEHGEHGQVPMPGEVSLAHHGMLLLDERPECRRHVLEVLRQPLAQDVMSIQSSPRHRPHRTRRPDRARGTHADRHRLASCSPGWLRLFA